MSMAATSYETFSNRIIKQIGAWSISLQLPEDGSIAALNRQADRATAAFLEAFVGMGDVEVATGDVEVLDGAGRVSQYFEDVPVFKVDGDRFRPHPDSGVPQPSEMVLLHGIWLVCGLAVDTGNHSSESGLYVPDSFRFSVGAFDTIHDDGRVVHEGQNAQVATYTDVWLDHTTDPTTRELRSNRRLAAVNRPRLEAFLSRWEQLTGSPIDWWESVHYKGIHRYGFSPEPLEGVP
jgi:hypothetical protein